MSSDRESIFRPALRSFFKAIGCFGGIALVFFFAMFALGSLVGGAQGGGRTSVAVVQGGDFQQDKLSPTGDLLLRVNVHGVIGGKELNASRVMQQLVESQEEPLSGRVKGVLLHVNSGGGGAIDSYAIYSMLRDYREQYQLPVYAYVEGMCASGAMMVSCSADKIFSNPMGIIGSVGVRMGPNFNFYDLLEQHGIKEKTLIAGQRKDSLNPYRPWNKEEGESIQKVIDANYLLFVNLVSKARPRLTTDDLIQKYGADIFPAQEAEEFGYVDSSSSTYREVVQELANAAGIEEEFQVVEVKVAHPLLSNLVDGKVVLEHRLEGLPHEIMEIEGPLFYYN
ncbi:MAG: S49 family peptidase [Chlamydiota bacterium]|nr:S49 family peptidase [Chlamydiota bacterium]